MIHDILHRLGSAAFGIPRNRFSFSCDPDSDLEFLVSSGRRSPADEKRESKGDQVGSHGKQRESQRRHRDLHGVEPGGKGEKGFLATEPGHGRDGMQNENKAHREGRGVDNGFTIWTGID